jgi:hypothetical protein
MKKVIVGLFAVGAVLGFGFAVRRMTRRMREHVGEMAAHCKEMMASESGASEAPSESSTTTSSKKRTAKTVVPTA